MTLYVADLLTATKATVAGDPAPTTSWKWNRDGTPIAGATSNTYTATTSDIGTNITVTETETNMLGAAAATSAASGPVVAFDPIALFQSNEPGTWYDPSDLTTLFEDSAGTTPVTTVERPVGLMLDKSKGLVLGSELVANGDFSNGTTTGWIPTSATFAVVSGEAELACTVAGTFQANYLISTTVGRTYKLTATIRRGTCPQPAYFGFNGVNSANTNNTTNTTLTLYIAATGATTNVQVYSTGASIGNTLYVDNISVRELPGNHAYQTTGTARPTLSARYNLLEKTEDFTNAYWGKNASVTVTSSGGVGTISVPSTIGSGTNIFFKQSVSPFANGATAVSRIQVRCTTGQSISLASDTGLTTVVMTSDWQTITLTSTIASSFHQFYIRTIAASQTYNFDIRFPDLRVSNDGVGLPAYQRVNTATDYDTVGFPLYLYALTDDCLLTNSINFSATDKMTVFAGVRKIGTATSCVYETSADAGLNNGAFYLLGDWDAVSKYQASVRGTSTQVATTAANYVSPITNVLTQAMDIAGTPRVELRANGASVATNNTSAGTGNFGNYPLYLFRRNNASLPFNGRCYSLIVRGAATSAAQVASTETWINNKMKAY